ncbi:P-loop containing nucleoside triphosphate hydrolase protein [Xylaria sp. CBS 124048]|nr:P-loop containing nucleoside triphosphate hydrolase protein [Xylaria sp. CBS 124048]
MTSPPWNYIAKLVCIGDSGCGKSSLTIRLCEGRFTPHHDVTIGVEFGSRIVPVGPPHSKTQKSLTSTSSTSEIRDPSSIISNAANDARKATSDEEQKYMKLSLWDTAGQEMYKSVTRSYFRGASGALLVFDITRRATFVHATDWLNDLRTIAEPDIVVILVGNKLDCVQSEATPEEGATTAENDDDKREVTFAEAQDWARQNGVLQYVETSAKSGENVEAAFMRVAERIFENINAGKYDLNDRRSGVKGPSYGTTTKGIKLTATDKKGSSMGGCC